MTHDLGDVCVGRMVIASQVSDPPALTVDDLASTIQESNRLSDAFAARTARMEVPTIDDLTTLVR